jgi:glycosyltransferase involved in cell wall biosynthesis
MKIAIFSECYSPIVNGIMVAVSTLRKELLQLGHQVYLFAPAYPGHQDTDEDIYRFPSLTLPTNPRYPLATPYSPQRLKQLLGKFAPDVIHSHSLFGMGRHAAKTARNLGIPLVFTYHTLLEAYAHYIPLPLPFTRWLARWRSRSFSNAADYVIAPGVAAYDTLLSYGVKTPIKIIPTGVDLSLAKENYSSPIRPRWDIPEGAPVVAFAGRIAKEKNLELLLNAFSLTMQKLPDAHLLLIGGGPWADHIQALTREMNLSSHVHLSGFLPRQEVYQALNHVQVFVFPSLTDTQGIVVLEAMACGLPVVAAKSGAVAEILRNGEEGLVVEPNPEAFAEALLALLQDPAGRNKMGEQARHQAEEFSSANCARKVVELYQEALDNQKPPPSR